MTITKRIATLALAFILGTTAFAQGAQETTVQIGMLTVPAHTLTIDKDVKMVQNALAQYLKDMKLKTVKDQGYLAAVDQLLPEVASAPINLYSKVEEQGKKKERVAVVTMCAISADLTIDQAVMRNNTRLFLENFLPYLERYEAGLNMQAEQKELKKAEKAAAAAVSEVNNLEKNISNDEKKIAAKRDEIKKLQAKIASLENEIKDLESNIQKNSGKKADAEQKVSTTQEDVNARQGEVERYRQMAQ